MHLLASLVVLLALLAWQRARTRPTLAWWPLAVLQLVGFGVKEDLVMLAPLLIVLTAVRRLMRRDVPWPGWPVTAIALAFPIGLFALRYQMSADWAATGRSRPSTAPGPTSQLVSCASSANCRPSGRGSRSSARSARR